MPLLHEGSVFILARSENEAHYLCALLNSTIMNFTIVSSTEAGGKSLAPPSVISHLKLVKFDSDSKFHQSLADLSNQAHKQKIEGSEKSLAGVEKKSIT